MIGSALIPELSRSRAALLMAAVGGAAVVLLGALPIELWVLPLAILVPGRARSFAAASLLGVIGALVALYHAGGHVGDSGVVPFLLETSGAAGIASFQQAQEQLGAGYAALLGFVGPMARDAALMSGQRGLPFAAFMAGVVVHALVRAALFLWVARVLAGRESARQLCRDYTLTCWVILAAISLLFA